MKKNILKIIGWGIVIFLIFAIVYLTILLTPGFNPAKIEMPSWAQSKTTSIIIIITFLLLLMLAGLAIESKKWSLVSLIPAAIFTICVMGFYMFVTIFPSSICPYYHNGKGWERAKIFDLNYPGKGGEFTTEIKNIKG